MTITFSKKFKREYKKLSTKTQKQVSKRLILFSENQNNPQLNNHRLHGKYKGYFSINVSRDTRAIYELLDKNTVLFIKIGTHSELY